MYIYEGKSVFGGIAIGKISVYKKEERQVRRVKAADTEAEITRFRLAKAEAIRQLNELYDTEIREVGEENSPRRFSRFIR